MFQAAVDIGVREYSRRSPPSLSRHLTGPDVTTGSERAIGVCRSSPRYGRAWLLCSIHSVRPRSRCRRLRIRIQSRHSRLVEPIWRSMWELAFGAAIGVLITDTPSPANTRSEPPPYLAS